MPSVSVHSLSKRYKLGLTHAGSVRELVNGFAGKLFGRSRKSKSPVLPEQGSRVDDKGNFWALKDVSFEIEPGEVVGVIGKNGAGKSTLLKLLSRITCPSGGRITLQGRVASLLEVGTGFHPELTGRENVYLNGTILGMSRREIDRQFDNIVDFAGVSGFIDTPTKRYSSGMTVRLGFAVAAHLNPEILIVDEVLAVGDAEFQKKCLGKMQEVSESGRTVLFVSHNLMSVSQLCARGIVLSSGSIEFDGEISAAIDRYCSVPFGAAARGGVFINTNEPRSSQVQAVRVRQTSTECDEFIRDDREFIIEFQVQHDQGHQDAILSVAVCNQWQQKIFTARTHVASQAGRVSRRLRVASRFLMPGRYSIIAGLLDEHLHPLDSHQYVSPFHVENVAGAGLPVSAQDGLVHGQFSWTDET